jgi:calcium-dependent protein kinase
MEGVKYMHSQNIMHRDLKPENLMFREIGNLRSLKIVDFGMATSTQVKKYNFIKCGTPGFIAPEIANFK